MAHDLDHPGNTNAFEIASDSDLALMHNDIHILENHHAMCLFKALRKNNILSDLPKDEFKTIRKLMIDAIIATDLSSHFGEINRVREEIEVSGENGHVFDVKQSSQRQEVVNLVIHSCDLSAQAGPLAVAAKWEQAITCEFQAQAEKETKMGLTPMPFMTNLTDPYRRAKLQSEFIRFVLLPWWIEMARIFPGLQICLDRLKVNMEAYIQAAKRDDDGKQNDAWSSNAIEVLPVRHVIEEKIAEKIAELSPPTSEQLVEGEIVEDEFE